MADIYGVDEKARTKRITQYAKELEIYDRLGDPIRTLSHGTKQKVAVIFALLHAPKLLLLDELFVGLDPSATYYLKQKMKEICTHGGSVLFSSHVLDVVENLVDQIAVIKDGSIVFAGAVLCLYGYRLALSGSGSGHCYKSSGMADQEADSRPQT